MLIVTSIAWQPRDNPCDSLSGHVEVLKSIALTPVVYHEPPDRPLRAVNADQSRDSGMSPEYAHGASPLTTAEINRRMTFEVAVL